MSDELIDAHEFRQRKPQGGLEVPKLQGILGDLPCALEGSIVRGTELMNQTSKCFVCGLCSSYFMQRWEDLGSDCPCQSA